MSFDTFSNLHSYSLSNSEACLPFDGELHFGVSSNDSAVFISAAPAIPQKKTVFVQDLGDERLGLRGPLAIAIERYGSQVIAYSADTGDFSVADNEIDAIDEFKASVVDLYFMLQSDKANLGKLPLRHWNHLRSVIEER